MMKLTEEQQAIIQENVQDALCVIAYAGCGKTSTLLEYARARKSSRILYMAFNRAMASEAQDKFRMERHVTARTVHSLAYSRIGHRYRESLGECGPWIFLSLRRSISRLPGAPYLGTTQNAKVQKALAFFVFCLQYGFLKSGGVRLHPDILWV